MRPLGLSANALALALRVPATRIGSIIRENRPRAVTADTALRLARYFGTTPEFWLNLPSAYLWPRAKAAPASSVRCSLGQPKPYARPVLCRQPPFEKSPDTLQLLLERDPERLQQLLARPLVAIDAEISSIQSSPGAPNALPCRRSSLLLRVVRPGFSRNGRRARATMLRPRFFGIAEAFERNRRLVGELDREPEAPAHGFDIAAQARDHEIAALFELGDGGLRIPRLPPAAPGSDPLLCADP
jgi:antitoxin HigA-1